MQRDAKHAFFSLPHFFPNITCPFILGHSYPTTALFLSPFPSYFRALSFTFCALFQFLSVSLLPSSPPLFYSDASCFVLPLKFVLYNVIISCLSQLAMTPQETLLVFISACVCVCVTEKDSRETVESVTITV